MRSLGPMTAPKRVHRDLTAHLAMCTPGVRMTVIEAWAIRDEEGQGPHIAEHQLLPVLAVIARETHRLSFEVGNHSHPPREFPSPEMMVADGWTYEDRDLSYDVLIHDNEFGLANLSLLGDGVNVAHTIAVCPWDSTEDEVRLADLIRETEQEAIEKSKAWERQTRRTLDRTVTMTEPGA
jgi:hypothetical protein